MGSGVFRLVSPRLKINVMVVQGTTAAALQAGAGHLLQSPMPGQAGNVVVVGHSRTFGRPFQRLAEARPGDAVTVTLVDGSAPDLAGRTYTYRVVGPFAGHINPWRTATIGPDVIGQAGPLAVGHWLTLVTKRIGRSAVTVARLELVKT